MAQSGPAKGVGEFVAFCRRSTCRTSDRYFQTLLKVNPQIVALGFDQDISEKLILDQSKKLGLEVEVIRLSSIYPAYSSEKIRRFYALSF